MIFINLFMRLMLFVIFYMVYFTNGCRRNKVERNRIAEIIKEPQNSNETEGRVILHPTFMYDISRPKSNWACGVPFNSDNDLRMIYRANETAEMYEEMGFTVKANKVFVDLLHSYNVSNETHSQFFKNKMYPGNGVRTVLGGEESKRINYMAIIGIKERLFYQSPTYTWLCGGVIINRHWILTAAHCFIDSPANIVRLGEHNIDNDEITKSEYPMDFEVREIISYPEYRDPASYHDLSLVQLKTPIFFYRPDMRPICLPWGEKINTKLLGKKIKLTGWGSLAFNGRMASVLQEVNLTVFDSAFCDRSYSMLADYNDKFPNGISSETILCAGHPEGGRDACMGDSGGPVVYEDNGRYTLAGIVSLGFGCGLKDYPGIYIPINRPEYLNWIKKVAFS